MTTVKEKIYIENKEKKGKGNKAKEKKKPLELIKCLKGNHNRSKLHVKFH